MGPIERAARTELQTLGISEHEDILAATAITLCREIDDERTHLRYVAALAQQLHTIVVSIRSFSAATSTPQADRLDELLAKRKSKAVSGA